jgi:rod shape determining protein RodA
VRGSLTRTALDRVHVGLAAAAAALLAYGSLMVWSATTGMELHDAMVGRHFLGVAVGAGVLGVFWLLDYQVLKAWTGPLMTALALLIISPVKGTTGWLEVFGVRLFQPSEPAKLLFILVMAAVIAEFGGRVDTPRQALRVAGFASLPVVLILLQPDLGTGMVFVAITFGMLLVGGMKRRYLVAVVAVGLAAIMLLVVLPWPLEQYQKDRLLVFVDPTRDPKGAGYNLAQSKIAIGSGGLTGKGLGAGTQSNLNFVPERHTDFIFSVLGEQLGFAGAFVLLGLYLALLSAALSISTSSRDLFGALVAVGVLSMWLFQVVENVGMAVGLMPITGIPLPFMSYGSSALVTNMGGVGMLLSVWSRRYGT